MVHYTSGDLVVAAVCAVQARRPPARPPRAGFLFRIIPRRIRILQLDPMLARTRHVRPIAPLRDDAFQAYLAGRLEYLNAVVARHVIGIDEPHLRAK